MSCLLHILKICNILLILFTLLKYFIKNNKNKYLKIALRKEAKISVPLLLSHLHGLNPSHKKDHYVCLSPQKFSHHYGFCSIFGCCYNSGVIH